MPAPTPPPDPGARPALDRLKLDRLRSLLREILPHNAFYAAKLATGRYFVERMLPDAAAHLAKVKTGAGAMMAVTQAQF